MKKFLITAGCFILMLVSVKAQDKVYLDMTKSEHERITDLLSRMTVDEKIDLLIASSSGTPRLGIDKYFHGNEGLHGVVRPGNFTVFPQAIGLASMWNPDLMYQVSTAISDEARARWNELRQGKDQHEYFSDLLSFWSPTINMARDPRWGRTPETYGEDPFLTGVLGTQFVKGLQGDDPRYLKVVSTPKHFAANNEEHNRFEGNAIISERDLREYYFPAFERCIVEGNAQAIMTAYNAINGVPCTLNDWLLKKVLREDWGFDGYVVSDCGGPALLVSHHKYIQTPEVAAALSLKAGLDLECGDYVYRDPLKRAYEQYMVSEEDIDAAAYRMLRFRMRLGLFDDPKLNPYNSLDPSIVGSKKHQDLALESARQSLVLLKNEKNFLPIDTKKVKSIAVVGINAASPEYGDYSGYPVNAPVSVLQGIKDRVGDDVEIIYAPWVSAEEGFELITKSYFPDGLKAEYFSNQNLEGTPVVRTDEWINFEPANQAPDPFLPKSPMSIRWTGKLKPPVSGTYTFGFTIDDGCRLFIDGEKLIDAWYGRGVTTDTIRIDLEAGKTYDLRAEYYDHRDVAVAKLAWRIPVIDMKSRLDLFGEAGEAVKKADLAIAVLGVNKSIEREGQDRHDIGLPKDQVEFIQEIYKANPKTVVVLVAGSSLAINWIDENIPAILDAWYPGEQGGVAVAEALFGDYNPGGRLPLTFYNSIEELAPFDDYNVKNGRSYQYFEGKPLYEFGYGLSYTNFRYDKLAIDQKGDEIEVSFNIANTGKYDGDEVAQLYVRFPDTGTYMPIKQLKGFQRVHIAKGKKERVTITVPKKELRYWNESTKAFETPSGEYVIQVGSSSQKINLQQTVTL